MNERFRNQVVLITGGADGLGKAIGNRLATEGANVILADKDEAKLDNTVGELKQAGLVVSGLPLDITNEVAVSHAYEHINREFGRIDIMINSAGIV